MQNLALQPAVNWIVIGWVFETQTNKINRDIHPKTPWTRFWLILKTLKGRGSEWAVRVGQRLPSRFVQSGAAREMNLVQIVVEAPAIRGGLPSTHPTQPVFGWFYSQRLVDYREGLAIRKAGYKLRSIENMACSWLS